MLRLWLILTIGSIALCSCTTLASLFGSFDDRSIVIHTLELFDQRQPPKGDFPDWKGDWIFRRERLAAVDQFLRSQKPDILVLQNVMSRRGSPSESDSAILAAGALVGFELSEQNIAFYDDTQEQIASFVAVSLPIQFRRVPDSGHSKVWPLGRSGYLALTLLENERQVISLFNVIIPETENDNTNWYQLIYEKIQEHFQTSEYCLNRIIVAGYLPIDVGGEQFAQFIQKLNLQETAEESCGLDEECQTRSPGNAFGTLVNPYAESGRYDRILVSDEALVLSSKRSFDNTINASDYPKRWGLDKIWPSVRYGWSAEVKFPKCAT